MDLFIYIMLFIMGTVFGSFFTLAVYRIPLKKNITHERSFCTTCGHRLEFLDMIPVLSYIFLKGKCRYCGEKIRIRYLLLEILSGLVFVSAYISLNLHFPYFDIQKIGLLISFIFMYITLAITAGIDKEYKQIHLGVILFGGIMQLVYILYLYILENINIYRYSIYFALMLIFLVINFVISKKSKISDEKIFNKAPYAFQIILLSFFIMCHTGVRNYIIIAVTTLILSVIKYFMNLKKQAQSENKKRISVGFFMNVSTIIITIIINFIKYY